MDTDTDMNPVERLQVVGRVRASRGTGVPLQTGTVPGQEMPRNDAQTEHWVPDAGSYRPC